MEAETMRTVAQTLRTRAIDLERDGLATLAAHIRADARELDRQAWEEESR